MLGAYNVNGAPCELLVEQDALTWWPRASSATGDNNKISPIKTQLRRLSSASSVIFSGQHQRPISSVDESKQNCDQQQEQQQQQQQQDKQDKNKRRLEFSQIVGLKLVQSHEKKKKSQQDESGRRNGKKSKRGGRDKKQGQQNGHSLSDDDDDEQTSDSFSRATISDESSSQVSQHLQASSRAIPTSDIATNQIGGQQPNYHQTNDERRATAAAMGTNFNKFKLYYAKRNEKKSSGRLLKLKKISIGPLDVSNINDNNHDTSDHESGAAARQNAKNTAHEAIRGLYELIEQHLEFQRRQRPKRLLVFVNPYGGKGRALPLYKTKVRKVLELAQVECELVVTKYANHARETIEEQIYNLSRFDGIICIGGDGMFGELMNGLLFRCNRDKLLASELSSMNRRQASDSLSDTTNTNTMNTTTTTHDDSASLNNDISQRKGSSHHHHHDYNNHHNHDTNHSLGTGSSITNSISDSQSSSTATATTTDGDGQNKQQLRFLRSSLGGIGEQFVSPSIPIGVIGAGSTDANLFGFLGTNDTISATLNIILGNQLQIDVCSIHSIQDDRLLRFVSTFVAYGYFGDVIRESEKFRWLGPSRYDLTALNSLIRYRQYPGLVRILRSSRDGTPLDLTRCHLNCRLCGRQELNQPQHSDSLDSRSINITRHQKSHYDNNMKLANSFSFDEAALAKLKACVTIDDDQSQQQVHEPLDQEAKKSPQAAKAPTNNHLMLDDCDLFEIVEQEGPFVGVNAAVTACRCPQTRKGFSPGNHLANGCADLILVRPCSRIQYINYLIRTGYTKKSAFDLKYVDAYRCRQFEFIAQPGGGGGGGGATPEGGVGEDDTRNGASSWNADGEILREESLRVKVNNRLLRVFGTGEPQRRTKHERKS